MKTTEEKLLAAEMALAFALEGLKAYDSHLKNYVSTWQYNGYLSSTKKSLEEINEVESATAQPCSPSK